MSASLEEFTFTNARGQTLHTVQMMPAGLPKAVLVWHHGLGEHCGRYLPMFRRMAEEGGVAAFSFDAHGHGKSEPADKAQRALIWRFDDLVRTQAAKGVGGGAHAARVAAPLPHRRPCMRGHPAAAQIS